MTSWDSRFAYVPKFPNYRVADVRVRDSGTVRKSAQQTLIGFWRILLMVEAPYNHPKFVSNQCDDSVSLIDR